MPGIEDDLINAITGGLSCRTDIKKDKMNNLIISRIYDESLPTVVLSAHMDEPGFIITDITDDGYLKFDTIGDINPSNIVSKQVKIGKNIGIISLKAIHLTTKEEREKPVKISDLFIDIGAKTKNEAGKIVTPGDYCSFVSEFSEFGENSVKGKSLSSRSGCKILIDILNNNIFSKINPICIFTTQKEVSSRGAMVALNNINNAMFAIIIDAINCTEEIKSSSGVVIGFRSDDTAKSRLLADKIENISDINQIKTQKQCVDKLKSDLDSYKSRRMDIPSVLLAIPCKYKNTATEVMDINDVKQVYDMLCSLLSEVNNGFVL